MGRRPFFLLLLLLVLAACSSSTPISPTAISTPPAQATATLTDLPSPTSTPTVTASPSATAPLSPTPTDTATPTPAPIIAVISAEHGNIVSGPAYNYAFLANFNTGFLLQVIGRSEDGAWLVVRLSEDTTGWIPVEQVSLEYDIGALPVFADPPVPLPTNTPPPFPFVNVSPAFGNPHTIYTITYGGFITQPGEFLTIEITHVETGTIAYSTSGPNNAGPDKIYTFRLRSTVHALPGTYLITISVPNGGFAQATIMVIDPGT